MAIVGIKKELCIGCGLCAEGCSIDVIRMDEETKKPAVLYPEDCMMCEMCIMVCPKDAVEFTPYKSGNIPLSW